MVAQTIQFEGPSLSQIGSGTIAAAMYSGATLVGALTSIAENGTRPGRYTGVVTDKAAATYDLIVRYNGYDVSDLGYQVTLQLADGTYIASGGGDATLANQTAILAAINTYIDGALATVNGTVATLVGFPSSLVVGDSYTTDGGNSIHVFIRDSNDDPITSVGTHDFTDPDFAPELTITSSGNAGRVRATVTYVDPGSEESYLKVEIPLCESRRAAPGTATMQCVLKWDGCQKTIATQTVTWVPRI